MKLLFLLLGSLAASSAAHAQLAVRLGGGLTRLRATEGQVVRSSSSAQAGLEAGLLYQLPLAPHLSLVPEVAYSYERTTLSQSSMSVGDAFFKADTRLRLHYLSVPVLVRASLGRVYLEAGPQASLLLGGRQTGTDYITSWGLGYTTQAYEIDQAAAKDRQRLDVGPCLGLGLALPAGLGVSVRAYQGLLALNEARSDADGKLQRQSLQASLTYQLNSK
ncbi:hypothetical protein GCM10023172_11010 [Hymenobacter ginsengisoli]|uniref:Outer membrane protein beta-barrel domain-containing protein n=1 Tax=Hymenobacter ginsengisoli TaxID=1051626 RepID=A0ABP8Q353_9BACT|nr:MULTISPECIES: porin family protein [unclassified Hymenobacter]MBO2031687.1 PorT family protein [Hymenobacter sp. BT559]